LNLPTVWLRLLEAKEIELPRHQYLVVPRLYLYRWGVVLTVVIATISPPAGAWEQQIRWRSVGAAPRLSVTSVAAARALGDLVIAPGNARHVVVQFSRPIDPVMRARLSDAGVELLDYLADNAFFAAVDRDRIDVGKLGRVKSLQLAHTIERDVKLHATLARGEFPQWSIVGLVTGQGALEAEPVVGLYILFHRDVPQDDAVQLVRRHGAEVRARLRSVNGLVIELPVSRIDGLADEDAVQWIEPPLPPLSETNDGNRQAAQTDDVQTPLTNDGNRQAVQANDVQASPYNLDGAGVVVMVYDGGMAYASHPDFGGRLTPRNGTRLGVHATHVSGTIGGDGGSLYRGMAPGVLMESYGFDWGPGGIHLYTNPGDIEADYTDAINNHGAVLANNSIGTNVENNHACSIQGDYGVTSSIIDAIVRGSLGAPIRVVWANGNERGGSRCNIEGFGAYYSIAPPAGAKNHITVGATYSNDNSVTSFTSWGPCDDGRLKPDICAPGCQNTGDSGVTSCYQNFGYTTMCGTSMSSPTETALNWQIVSIDAEPHDWLDAPVLYLASHQAVPWAAQSAALANLTKYLDLGGLIFAVNEGRSHAFAHSIEAMGQTMYPQLKWRTLPADHWVYTILWPIEIKRPPLRGLSNGVRELIILSADTDFSAAFQVGAPGHAAKPEVYRTAAHIYLYASEMNRPRPRLARHFQTPSPLEMQGEHAAATIVRARHGGNWNPEPAALDVFAAALAADPDHPIRIRIVDDPLAAIDRREPPPALVIASGINARKFTTEQRRAIRAYVNAGGVILFETPGGLGDFTRAAESACRKIFQGAAGPIQPLLRSPIITAEGLEGAARLVRVGYRPYSLEVFGARETRPRLRGMLIDGQYRVLFSRDDLTHALLNQPCWGVSGYSPATARNLLANILRHALRVSPSSPAASASQIGPPRNRR